MVGNDIIDVKKVRQEIRYKDPRFIDKLFTTAEQFYIKQSRDSILMLWRLWSIKESAYKLFIQNGGGRFFNPKKISCVLDGNHSIASINTFKCKVTTRISSDYIFSHTVTNSNNVISKQVHIESTNQREQSKELYFLLKKEISERLKANMSDISLKKNTIGVPLLYLNKTQLNCSVSLSHHGNYGAYSICKL